MWKLGRILGIDVSLHWTLLLLVAWTGVSAPVGGAWGSVAFITAIFACVLAHEFGHSLAARQFGIETSSIVLLPIGGIASLERMPRDPKQELWVAVAGPLVNVVIATLLFAFRGYAAAFGPEVYGWLSYLMLANIGLVVFNMLPAFPMDGGRVFRALAAMVMPYVRATNLAASVGRVVAVLLGIVGFTQGHLMLMLIAAFVFFAGSAEAKSVAAEAASNAFEWTRNLRTQSGIAGQRVFRGFKNGRNVAVIWDDDDKVYRYVTMG